MSTKEVPPRLEGSGVLPINKPAGMTSFDSIRHVKKSLGIKKIGHTGTLDKFAEGLLILLYGDYTRLASLFLCQDKEYIAKIRFGKMTKTLDPEGEVILEGSVPDLDTIKACLPRLKGRISQVPPQYSAVHVNGQRAYKLARKGEDPVLAPRDVTIYELDLIDYTPPVLRLRVLCSKGTYIRALARDLGFAADSCAYVEELRRTSVGRFHLNNASDLNDLATFKPCYSAGELAAALKGVKALRVKEEFETFLLSGVKPQPHFFYETVEKEGDYFALDSAGQLLAVIGKKAGGFYYRSVLGKRSRC